MVKNKEPYYVINGEKAEQRDKDARHCEGIFKAKHKKMKNGKIIIELTPATEEEKKRNEMIETITGKLKDSIDKEELMKDILQDIPVKSLEKMDKALKRGAKVQAKEGCYYISIKEPKKKGMALRIRK